MLVLIGVAVAVVGSALGRATPWRDYPERLAAYVSRGGADLLADPVLLSRELGRERTITGAEVKVQPDPSSGRIHVLATVRAQDRTGVEMEALTAAAVAALSLYDTAKPYDRAAVISDLRLVAKRGGKSGEYRLR